MTAFTILDSVQDSLERVTSALRGDGPRALKGALCWGWHAVELLAYARLEPHAEQFDAWLQAYFQPAAPELDVERDARWDERQRLGLLELLDVLSEETLPILKPEFYQGWQDRTSRCHGIRRLMNRIVGSSVGSQQRDALLLLLAAHQRLVRVPSGVELDAAEVRQAFPALLGLVDQLVAGTGEHADAARDRVEQCRRALRED